MQRPIIIFTFVLGAFIQTAAIADQKSLLYGEGTSGSQETVQYHELTQAMQQYRISHENQLKIHQEIRLAAQNGIPVDSLVNKVFEGMAKNVDEDRITGAIAQVRMRYENAYRYSQGMAWLDQPAKAEIAQLLSDAQVAGLTDADTAKIMDRLRLRTRDREHDECQELSLQVMATTRTLARHRVHSSTLTELVAGALDADYSPRDMQLLRQSFRKEVRYNHEADIAGGYARAIQNGATASNIATGYANRNRHSYSHGTDGSGSGNQGSGQGNGNSGSGGGHSENSSGGQGGVSGSSGNSGGGSGNGNAGNGNSAGGGGGGSQGRGRGR